MEYTICSFNPCTERGNTAEVPAYCSELQIAKVLNIVLYKIKDVII